MTERSDEVGRQLTLQLTEEEKRGTETPPREVEGGDIKSLPLGRSKRTAIPTRPCPGEVVRFDLTRK